MLTRLQNALAHIESIADALEPQDFNGEDALLLVDLFGKIERIATACRTRMGRRVEETRAWYGKGHPSAAKWMAEQAQTTLASAITTMETGRRLEHLPETRRAFISGELSAQQAGHITAAASLAPEAERSLLEIARVESVNGLRNRCNQIQAAAASRDLDADERIARGRYLRWWRDPDGAVRVDARLTPDGGARFLAKNAADAKVLEDRARAAGSRERHECYAADALVGLGGASSSRTSRAIVNIHVDYEALKRGYLKKGERCEIPGFGPVSVAAAKRLSEDAVINAVLTHRADVRAFANVGRPVPVRLRRALEARDTVCVVPSCDETKNLELHHLVPICEGGLTTLDNLARPCTFHHMLITHFGWRLEGRPGRWQFLPPVPRERPPPDE
jgi:hypothetical protein